MKVLHHLAIAGCALLLGLSGITRAADPCTAFEGGKVDVKLLSAMRKAADEGRLYRVVPGQSRAGFCVRHFPLQEFRGEFTHLVGGLTLPSPQHDHGQALLLIHTTNMQSSNPALEPLVQGREWMDTKSYPDILFIGRAFQWLGPQHGYIYGDITLHGVTRPIVFDISVRTTEGAYNGLPGQIHLRGTGQVNRLRFDIHSNRYTVSETVRLCLDVSLTPWNN